MDKIKIPKETYERFKRLRVPDAVLANYEIDDSIKPKKSEYHEVYFKNPWDDDSGKK